MTDRENYLRNVKMTGPEWIPVHVNLSDSLWNELGEELDEVVARHPRLFPNHDPRDFNTWAPRQRKGQCERDPWGVLWDFEYDGIEGQTVEHPLDDWAKFNSFEPPDPMRYTDRTEIDWDRWHADVHWQKERGELTEGNLDHGYFLMRLWYLRGFDNLMLDIATGEPRLRKLCEMVTRRNLVRIRQFIAADVDVVYFGEDLGTQTASIISPRDFREWVLPYYRQMMGPVREAGIVVDTHSDGYIMELVDLLLDAGADVLNPQDLCNGIDNIEREIKGRCCIKLDVDRQKIIPFGTPGEIRDLIEEETRKLGSPEGGLSFISGVFPPTPPENVDALLSAFEEFQTYWWE